MQLTHLQKAKIILVLNFVALFIIIIATPFFIDQGTSFVPEEVVEGMFLSIELIAAIFVFRHYDVQMKKKEEEATLLNLKLEKKERELLGALEYLGKVNVQISMIRSIFEATKVPSTKSQLHEMYNELLRIVSSVTKEEGVSLRVVNLKTKRTLSEHTELVRDEERHRITIGNNELAKQFAGKENEIDESELKIFYSDAENFYIKTFLFVPHAKTKQFSSEETMFLKAIASQCEIMFLLFNSRYYKG